MMSQHIFDGVVSMLRDALNLDKDEPIDKSSRIFKDLGAESIDALDIVFRIERTFGIRVDRLKLFPELPDRRTEEWIQNNALTDAGLQELEQRMPFADLSCFEHERSLNNVDLKDLFTVGYLCDYLATRVPAPATPVA